MLDLKKMLTETTEALEYLKTRGPVPEEAFQMQEILQRCIAAEESLANQLEGRLCLGRAAYQAYCVTSDGKSLVSGATLPTWDELKPEIQAAWNLAGANVASLVIFQLSDRNLNPSS